MAKGSAWFCSTTFATPRALRYLPSARSAGVAFLSLAPPPEGSFPDLETPMGIVVGLGIAMFAFVSLWQLYRDERVNRKGLHDDC